MTQPAFTHIQDVVLRDGKLASEIWGRVIWVVHGQYSNAKEKAGCRADFPGFNRLGLGFVCRLYGTDSELASIAAQLQPLIDYGFIGVEPPMTISDDATEWGVTYRPKRMGVARERRHRKRAAERALREGAPLPDFNSPLEGYTKRGTSHAIRMMSVSNNNEMFPLVLTRQVLSSAAEAEELAQAPLSGSNYGVGYPVPLIKAASSQVPG